MIVVAISGKARAGKDSAALYCSKLLSKNQIKHKRLAFATLLKKEVYQYILKKQRN